MSMTMDDPIRRWTARHASANPARFTDIRAKNLTLRFRSPILVFIAGGWRKRRSVNDNL